MKVVRFLGLIALLAVAACGSDPVAPRITETTFAPSLGINLNAMTKRASGLYIQTLVEGEDGPGAGFGDRAYIRYTGWLTDGTQFDSNLDAEVPFLVWIGAGGAIDGFVEGVRGMQVGAKRRLIVPPHLGYGRQGSGAIPGNAILIFEIELESID